MIVLIKSNIFVVWRTFLCLSVFIVISWSIDPGGISPATSFSKTLIPSNIKTCQKVGRPGDCEPEMCREIGRSTCESRYTRFWDPKERVDRTQKSCQCLQESICSLFGAPFYGCKSYASLSISAQALLRQWTMSQKVANFSQLMLA
ncbi:hypothetical protein DdX_01524 [Ditylenchus destructor]|uniref:Uncharacterized protein n=1 Tax=Ditylenchus destructor TaxID=166010 RepID=A0AAD4RDT5_9BILA|nr:hypothetical protein DdX_01524 [Ditylenchus destructor]